jgi:type IV pilus assembly protein PilA
MLKRLRQGQKGFTLIELLIVIAIIGIIAALLIPNFIDALQKGKQKRTMGDAKNMGTAMFSYQTDMAQGAAAGAGITLTDFLTITAANLETLLSPQYIQTIPVFDGWKENYEYWLTVNPDALPAGDPAKENLMAIFSGARDGNASLANYTAANFEPTDYDQDIVWANGFFVRWPGKGPNVAP